MDERGVGERKRYKTFSLDEVVGRLSSLRRLNGTERTEGW